MFAFIFGAISVALASIGLATHVLLISAIGLGFGVIGFLIGWYIAPKPLSQEEKMYTLTTRIISITGLTLGGIGLGLELLRG